MCLSKQNANCVYINATYREAREIMWAEPDDGLPRILKDLDLGCTFNEARLEVTFRNGSRITLLGADRGAWEKLRGNKFDLVVVDESQKMEDDGFRNALAKVLPATLVARNGRCILIGTPDEFCVGIFHDICTETTDPATGQVLYPQFEHKHWDASENDRRPDIWERLLAWKEQSGYSDNDPIWLREGKGMWVRQDSSLILPLGPASLWDGKLPLLIPNTRGELVARTSEPQVYAGCDFGWTDAFAVTVGSISREEGVLREVHSFKRSNLNTAQVADVLRKLMTDYGVKMFYGDAAGAQTIADLRQLYGLPVTPSDKHDKAPWIQEMRSHLSDGRFQVLQGSMLHDELKVLSPDPEMLRKRKIETRPGSDDHCYDSARYLFRSVWTNHIRTPEAPKTPEDYQTAHIAKLKAEALRPKAKRR
jgi:hypothetical protein